MIVVPDSNVIVSALNFGTAMSSPVLALDKAVKSRAIATCDEIEGEIRRILTAKFEWSPQRVEQALGRIFESVIRVEIHGTVRLCRDPDDDKILECAERTHASWIVTGDRDLLSLGSYGGIRIVSPAEYLRL
jgi:putative PIN family toxin of toxin-antitoxin system